MLISVILAFNQEEDIPVALDRLAGQADDCEVIVVDGRRANGKPVALGECPARIIPAPAATVGAQFNAGAVAARGDVLLFLYLEGHIIDNVS